MLRQKYYDIWTKMYAVSLSRIFPRWCLYPNFKNAIHQQRNFSQRTLSIKSHCKPNIILQCGIANTQQNARGISTTQQNTNWEKPEGYDTGIKLWNSITKRKDPLILRNDRIGTWYVCGPTVYDSAHIGHGSTYMRFDIMRRIMANFFDINLMVVLGITDIDDKLIARSKETNIPFSQISWTHEIEFFEDMAALNILPPSKTARVTKHVPDIIDFIQGIIDKGYAYKTPSGSVYFDINKYGKYGKLCSHAADVEEEADNHEKKNRQDFALWKAAKVGEPEWEAPWGNGRPGWHIECSTMASVIFGNKLDLHSGGEDLLFPHHENEIAQSEAYHDCSQWANYWIHAGHLYLKGSGEKMSKSLKNFVTISEFLETYTADQFRVLCLLTPYKNRIEYTEETMQKAVHINKQILNCLHHCDAYVRGQLICQPIDEERLHKSLYEARHDIEAALADDFNTARVMENVMELVKQLNIALATKTEISSGPRSPAVISYTSNYLYNLLSRLGLQPRRPESQVSDPMTHSIGHVMDSVVKFRTKVRNFAINPPETVTTADKSAQKKSMAPLLEACDEVREDLKAANVQIIDHGKDASWKVITEDDK